MTKFSATPLLFVIILARTNDYLHMSAMLHLASIIH